jgi:hypothetical protein
MNEALNLQTNGILDKLNLSLEAFTDDLAPAFKQRGFSIELLLDKDANNVLYIHWTWDDIEKDHEEKFIFNVTNTEENYINRVKAYLFDLLVSLANL